MGCICYLFMRFDKAHHERILTRLVMSNKAVEKSVLNLQKGSHCTFMSGLFLSHHSSDTAWPSKWRSPGIPASRIRASLFQAEDWDTDGSGSIGGIVLEVTRVSSKDRPLEPHFSGSMYRE